MTRRLVLMGSGETTPTMVEVHKRILATLGDDPTAVLVETPYGFQENAPEITDRARQYFDRNVGTDVRAVPLRRVEAMSAATLEDTIAAVEEADWVFAGPGSPSYLLRQWRATRVPDVLRERLQRPGAMVFASAAVCTLGARTLPVYEIYKVGEDPHWLPGLDLTAALGLDCVVIPHFDNTEGGTHDTRFCYLGQTRLERLEEELPAATWVLGVDEHTAMLIDLDTGAIEVDGRGGVTVRRRDGEVVFPSGSHLTLAELQAAAAGTVISPTSAAPTGASAAGPPPGDDAAALPGSLGEAVAAHRARFDAALADEDAIAAADEVLGLLGTIAAWEADTNQSDELARADAALRRMVVQLARIAQAGLHDHRDLVAPHVETLLDLRADARTDRDFATADRIRDALVEGGVEVHDTADGVEWELPADPLATADD